MIYSLNAKRIFTPDAAVVHRDEEYDPHGFELLRHMQSCHFWYQGRHRFLLAAVNEALGRIKTRESGLKAIDLGGGCGGWITYLNERIPDKFAELALSDSCIEALEMAGTIIAKDVDRYQIDLLRLGWENRWDIAFLLDVLEHIPNDREVLLQIKQALNPGGLLFVTTPALQCFWSYNDEVAHHVRRYAKRDFTRIAQATGFHLLRASYFMFFLSPLLWLSRRKRPKLETMTEEARRAVVAHSHRVPAAPVNRILKLIFDLETPLGLRLPFPWGTSVLGVFQKPC